MNRATDHSGRNAPPPAPHVVHAATTTDSTFDARTIDRPDRILLGYYLVSSLRALIFAPIVFIPLYLRYITLRYRFDDEGISMSAGLLFRHEVHLTYRRIQDIHVTRGLLQRYFGLSTILIQTASGSAGAEMQIDGIVEADALRDWLYARMRGSSLADATAVDAPDEDDADASEEAADETNGARDETAELLEAILHETRELRARLEKRP